MESLNSPDLSVPSLADTSMGSPDDSHDVDHDEENSFVEQDPVVNDDPPSPRRVWFRHDHDGDSSAFTMYNLCHYYPSSSPFGTPQTTTEVVTNKLETFSTTSSDTTVMAGRNLTSRIPEPEDTFFLKGCLGDRRSNEAILDSPPRIHIHESSRTQSGTDVPEETIGDMPSCTTALSMTPRQIVDLFGSFQTRKRTPDVQSDIPTLQEELLLRECTLLKQIIQDDADAILQLKQTLEEQQKAMAQKDMDLHDMELEIRMALDRIDALKREKDVMREREDEFNNTIRILKMEVDKLSSTQVQNSLAGNDASIDARVDKLTNQNIAMVDGCAPRPDDEESVDTSFNQDAKTMERKALDAESVPIMELASLSMMIHKITHRLESVEARNELPDGRMPQVIERQCIEMESTSKGEIPTPRAQDFMAVYQGDEHHMQRSDDFMSISQSQEGVEVLLPRRTKKEASKTDVDVDCCCMVWTLSVHGLD